MLNIKWRSYFLAITVIYINLMAAYAFLKSDASNRSIADFQFPQKIKLTSDKVFVDPNIETTFNSRSNISSSEPEIELKDKIIAAHQKYRYTSRKLPIDLEMNYLVDTQGEVKSYLQQYTPLSQKVIVGAQQKYIKGVGYHTLLTTSDRIYLNSCISPRSLSNVTQKQFSEYRYQNDLKLYLFWGWLQGKTSIRDRRCLWVNLSTPRTPELQTAYKVLETTWQELYNWWLPNYPQLY